MYAIFPTCLLFFQLVKQRVHTSWRSKILFTVGLPSIEEDLFRFYLMNNCIHKMHNDKQCRFLLYSPKYGCQAWLGRIFKIPTGSVSRRLQEKKVALYSLILLWIQKHFLINRRVIYWTRKVSVNERSATEQVRGGYNNDLNRRIFLNAQTRAKCTIIRNVYMQLRLR